MGKPIKLAVVAVAVAMAVVSGAGCWFARSGNTSSAEARRMVSAGALLLDVRSPEEFKAGHIEGAVNIPVQELEGRMGELGAKEKPIVVYCQSGGRSARAAAMLEGAGYTEIHNLGAMSRW